MNPAMLTAGGSSPLTSGGVEELDSAWERRRDELEALARTFRRSDPVPYIEYRPEERDVWATALRLLRPLQLRLGCREFVEGLSRFSFDSARVPQLTKINRVLGGLPRFRMIPRGHPDDALESLRALADGTFLAPQHLRAAERVRGGEAYLVHALLGHAPLLAHPRFAQVHRLFGEAAREADTTLATGLHRAWWHVMEFGMVAEGPELRLVGARLLSSVDELHSAGKGVVLRPLDLAEIAATPVEEATTRRVRFVAEDSMRLLSELERWLVAVAPRT